MPAVQFAASQDAIFAETRQLIGAAPRLAFEKAALLRDPLLRQRMRRLAYLAMADRFPADAAAHLDDFPWLGSVPFSRALDIAWHSIQTKPELTRRLLTASAARWPDAALRARAAYIELPYGAAIWDAAAAVAPEVAAALTGGKAAAPFARRATGMLTEARSGAPDLTGSEVVTLAALAASDEEIDIVTRLATHVDWTNAGIREVAPDVLRAGLSLLAAYGVVADLPPALVDAARRGLETAEDPVAEAARLAAIAQSHTGPPKLAAAELFRNGECLQRHVFHDDSDGVESFDSFLAAYTGDPAWKIEHFDSHVRLTGAGAGRRIVIYANIPMRNGQGAVAKAMPAQPLVLVHRGHDHHFPATRPLLNPEARLVYLGSCRGMSNVEDVVLRCPRASMIAARAVGITAVNDALLKAINTRLLSGAAELDWDALWSSVPGVGGYVPPHRNHAAVYLADFYRRAIMQP